MNQNNNHLFSTDMSKVRTYQSGIAQASANRMLNRIISDYLLQYNLTAMQWYIIGAIYDAGSGGMRLSDLMRKVHTTLPYITNTVALLESRDIVKKISHEGDSRIKLVSIQKSYESRIDEIENGLRTHLRQTLYNEDGITRQELQDYITVLYKIIQYSKP